MKLFLFFLLLGGGFLISCDDTHEQFTPPRIQINKSTTGEVVDSMKNAFKNRVLFENYSFTLRRTEGDIAGIRYTTDNGNGLLQGIDEGVTYKNNIPLPSGSDTVRVGFRPDKGEGLYHLKFSGYNRYGVQGNEVTLTLYVYDNLLPEARMTYSTDAPSGDHAMLLDASGSYDRDGPPKGMGKIVTYDFTVEENGKTHKEIVYTPLLHISFEEAGTYRAVLVVYDDEGASSKPFTTEVIVP